MNLQLRLERRRKNNPNKIRPMNAIVNRLSEQSTWRGIILVLTSLGVAIQKDYHDHIIAIGIALVGIINIIRRERKIPRAEVVE
jgi:hypothetical protein